MTNWLENSAIENQLAGVISLKGSDKVKKMLIDYCQRYQDIYPFELLDRPLLFLKSSALLDVTFRDVQDDLAVAAGEYCSSLNEVAEALLVLTDTGVFGKAQAVKVINHILEAYSCNETVEEFLNREIAYLSGELSALV